MPSTEIQIVFWAAAVVVAYAYAGYPLLLALLARLRPAPAVRKGDATPQLTVLIVARDEEQRLGAKLLDCLALDYPEDLLEVLVVSDGSRDRTEAVAAAFADRGVRLLALPGPGGKAAALNRAVPQCRGEILLLSDARQHLAPDSARRLVECFADPTVGAVSGELHIEGAPGTAAGEGVGAYWRYEKRIRRAESRLDSTVGVTGALYALRRELYPQLDPRTILDDVAIPMGVVGSGRRVLFEPAARAYDRAAETPQKEYRRKVRTLAGNYQLAWLHPWLLDPRANRLWWQFVSHKLSRLAVPWCLLATLVSSALLGLAGSSLFQVAFAAQAAFYLLAVAGWSAERFQVRVPWLTLPYAFALLNMAAAWSLFGFLLGTQRAAWKGAA